MLMTETTKLKPDTRNLHWKANNVGSKIMAKMGWKDGQAVGKRQRHPPQRDHDDVTAHHETVKSATTSIRESTGEGLRILKRQDGLGLGANARAAQEAATARPVQGLAELLTQLKQEHASSSSSSTENKRLKKKKKKDSAPTEEKKDTVKKTSLSKSIVHLPTNKTTHHKVRQAKFQAKTEEDMRCIFGGDSSSLISDPFVSMKATATSLSSSKKASTTRDETGDANGRSDAKKSKKLKKAFSSTEGEPVKKKKKKSES